MLTSERTDAECSFDRRNSVKYLVIAATVAGSLFGTSGVTQAAAAGFPAKACIGESVSGNAQALSPYGSLVVSGVARDKTSGRAGVGDEVAAVRAGLVP